jgi:hypothetical protein
MIIKGLFFMGILKIQYDNMMKFYKYSKLLFS